MFHAGPLLIVHDHGPITHGSVGEDFKAVQPVIDQYDEVSFLRVFEANLVGRPIPSVVRAVELRLEGIKARRLCSALVVLGTGLAPVWMRTAMAGNGLIAGRAARRMTFDTLREALTWLQSFEGQHQEVKAIELEALEQALSTH